MIAVDSQPYGPAEAAIVASTVLIVEDDLNTLRLVTLYLQRDGLVAGGLSGNPNVRGNKGEVSHPSNTD